MQSVLLRKRMVAMLVSAALSGVAASAVAVDAAKGTTTPSSAASSAARIAVGKELIGHDVRGDQNVALGKVEDIVIDRNGVTQYLVIAPAKDLAMGNKRVVVPWLALTMTPDGSLTLAASKDKFTKAPTWSDKERTAKSDWDNTVYDYYGLTFIPDKAQFSQLDMNKDNQLSQDEAQINRRLGTRFKQLDKDSNGSISQSEFSAFEAAWPESSPSGSM